MKKMKVLAVFLIMSLMVSFPAVTMAAGTLTMADIVYTDAEGNVITTIEPGDITATATLLNNTVSGQDFVMITALYTNRVMQQVVIGTVESAGANNKTTATTTITVPNDGRNYYTKTFVWNSLAGLEPVKVGVLSSRLDGTSNEAKFTATLSVTQNETNYTYTGLVDDLSKTIEFTIPYGYPASTPAYNNRYTYTSADLKAVTLAFSSDNGTTVTGGGALDMSEERPTVTVTAPNGAESVYAVKLFRQYTAEDFENVKLRAVSSTNTDWCFDGGSTYDTETGLVTGTRDWALNVTKNGTDLRTKANAGENGATLKQYVDVVADGTDNHALRLQTDAETSSSAKTVVQLGFKPLTWAGFYDNNGLSGNVVVDYKFKLTNPTTGTETSYDYLYHMSLTKGISASNGILNGFGTWGTRVLSRNGSPKYNAVQTGNNVYDVMNVKPFQYNPEEWHSMRIIYSTSSTAASAQYYFDGVKYGTEKVYNSLAAIDGLVVALSDSRIQGVMIDDLKVGIWLD